MVCHAAQFHVGTVPHRVQVPPEDGLGVLEVKVLPENGLGGSKDHPIRMVLDP